MRSATLKQYLKILKAIFPGRKTGWVAMIIALLMITIAVVELREPQSLPANSDLPYTSSSQLYPVEYVVDGDTVQIVVGSDIVTVRLIGVDTPESVDPRRPVQCFGRQATDYTRSLLTGKEVYVEADPSQDNADKYQRLLRYIKLPDGTDVNGMLLRQGYAYEYTFITPYQRQESYQLFEEQARQQGLGLWDPGTCGGQR